GKLDARAADRFGREHGGRDARLHVARPAPEDLSVAQQRAKRFDRPAVACGHDIDVAVEVYDRSSAAASRTYDVHSGIAGGVFRATIGDDVLDVETTAAQMVADEMGAGVIG